MNKTKLEYGNLIRKHLQNHDFWLQLSPEEFVKLRRNVRRKATRELADAALRAYLGVLGIPLNGALTKQPMRNLAALSISGKRITRISAAAAKRLDRIAAASKQNMEKNKTHRITHQPQNLSLGK